MKRKARKGEYTCNCNAYKFPHRFGGGKCTGIIVVQGHWNTYWGSDETCSNCNLNNAHNCEVLSGLEKETECTVFQEFIDYEEVKLLGKYWR